ncbi:MAG: F0F1 ATP synthase subunit A [Candidatus Omnitrophota bacterium]|nr:F0F1 ATP synthase subunit A [Candidatus Omnitrophota bacterium]
MENTISKSPELPNIVTLLAERLKGSHISQFLLTWENIIFSLLIVSVIALGTYMASRKLSMVPGRLQNLFEMFVGGVDDFVCGIIGPHGRNYVPFIGTLFIYILCMNLSGLIPLIKSPSASWSTTLALAICVAVYTIYAGVKVMGLRGFIDHLLGRPRGIIAFSIFIPLMMFVLEIVSLIVRPISLSLRLRSNIWGDDMLLAVFAGFGLKGIPLLFFNSLMAIVVSLVQTFVFCLLTTIYFTLVLTHEEEKTGEALR